MPEFTKDNQTFISGRKEPKNYRNLKNCSNSKFATFNAIAHMSLISLTLKTMFHVSIFFILEYSNYQEVVKYLHKQSISK